MKQAASPAPRPRAQAAAPAATHRSLERGLAAIELQPWEVAFLHLARSAIEVIEPGAGAPGGPG